MRITRSLAALALATSVSLTGAGVATASAATTQGGEKCAAAMHEAVLEDNAAFEARDAERYEAVLHPDVVVVRDNNVTYGRDAVMAGAIAFFAVPGWHWYTDVVSETMYGCKTGVAVLDVHQVDATNDYHARVTMTMVKYHGDWVVALDTVHVLSITPVG